MKILAVDTTTFAGQIVLGDGSKIIFSKCWSGSGRHAQSLADEIRKALEKAKWTAGDIEGVGVALGPGSFTGLRIGLATIKGLACGNSLPIAGYGSLFALAKSHESFDGVVVPTIDARRGEVYAAAYNFEDGCDELLAPCAIPPERLSDWIRSQDSPSMLAGDGASLYKKILKGKGRSFSGGPLPKPGVVLELVGKKLNEGGDDLDKLVPAYVRLSDAEIGFRGK